MLPEEQKDLPNVALTSQIVYQVLAAEVALQRNLPAPAYQTYLALARDTRDPRMAQRATEIALAAQSPADALTAANLWREYSPDSQRAAQVDAALLVLGGKPAEAQPMLAQELARATGDNRGQAIIALQALLARGPNRVGGLTVLQDLLKNDMNRPEARLAIARQQLATDDKDGATQSLKEALRIKPDYLPAALMLSQMGPGERAAGIASFEKFVQQNPKSRDGRLALAQLYLADDRLDDAQKQFDAMRRNDSSDPTPLMAIALIKIQQKHLDDATTYLKQYVKVAQKKPGADVGQAYVHVDGNDGAVDVLLRRPDAALLRARADGRHHVRHLFVGVRRRLARDVARHQARGPRQGEEVRARSERSERRRAGISALPARQGRFLANRLFFVRRSFARRTPRVSGTRSAAAARRAPRCSRARRRSGRSSARPSCPSRGSATR